MELSKVIGGTSTVKWPWLPVMTGDFYGIYEVYGNHHKISMGFTRYMVILEFLWDFYVMYMVITPR